MLTAIMTRRDVRETFAGTTLRGKYKGKGLMKALKAERKREKER